MADIFLGETVNIFASVLGNNTSAGAAIATIPAGSLPSGLYAVEVTDTVSAAATPVLVNNVELRVGGVSRRRIFHVAAVYNSTAVPFGSPQRANVRVDGTQSISVNFVANFGAAETQTHDVLLQATKVRD